MVQDEVYRIAREVLRNAFRHARARQIEAEIRYDDRSLRLRIRDDGKGIDPGVLEEGERPGHWGLLGMRERAKRIGAQLDFWSEAGAGTEVELTVPASVAYAKSLDAGGFRLFRKRTGTHAH
jgi:signal transduction histidine kinase